MSNKSFAIGALIAAGLACSTAAALGASDNSLAIDGANSTPPVVEAAPPASAAVLRAFPALGDPARKANIELRSSMRSQMGATSSIDHGPIGTADFDLATASAVAGSAARASIVPSGDRICLVLEDVAGGFGASCPTMSDVAKGRGIVALGSRSLTATVAVLVPEGSSPPTFSSADGSQTPLLVDGNVAAAVLPLEAGGSLDIGSESIPISAFRRR